MKNASPLSGRKTSVDWLSSPLSKGPLTNGKGKEPAVDLKSQAISFSKKSSLVKHCFDRWRTRLTDRLAWVEACQRSDAYSQKIQHERSFQSSMPDRKRRVAPGASLETPQRKRARKRVSGEYKKPHTDEELARRFKAVSESHLRFELKIDANCIARIMKSMSAVGQKGLSSGGASPPVSPGLIVFECTPLEGVTDEIERLYFIPS